ncbi:MAG: LysR family transcriptional regulator [Salinarimonas sp.]
MDAEPFRARDKNLDLRLLHQYVEICRQPSFAASAAALGVSKPAVSQIVARLEGELGVALFERGRTGLRLLPAGRRLLDLARTIIADERDALAEMRRFREHAIPRLRVYVLDSMSPLIITALYEALADKVGAISVESGRGGTCVSEFLRGEIDVIVSTERFDDMLDTLDVHLLCRQDLCLVAPPPPPGEPPMAIEALAASLPLVRAPDNTRMHAAIAAYLAGRGIVPLREVGCRSLSTTLEIICAGRGWALLPPLTVTTLRDRLEQVSIGRLPGGPPGQTVALAADRDRFLEIPAAVADVCREALRDRLARLRAGGAAHALEAVHVY